MIYRRFVVPALAILAFGLTATMGFAQTASKPDPDADCSTLLPENYPALADILRAEMNKTAMACVGSLSNWTYAKRDLRVSMEKLQEIADGKKMSSHEMATALLDYENAWSDLVGSRAKMREAYSDALGRFVDWAKIHKDAGTKIGLDFAQWEAAHRLLAAYPRFDSGLLAKAQAKASEQRRREDAEVMKK